MKIVKKRLAVIGGGASGTVAAIEAKQEFPQAEVVIFEKMTKACKKILVTGNGRCNFTNEDLAPRHFYGETNFLRKVLTSVYADTENYFRSLGILSYHEDGRIYPRSQQSSAIREALISKAESLGIVIKFETSVSSLKKTKTGYLVNCENFDAVIIAGGGKASAVQGSDGSCFPLVKEMNHTFTPLYPALCGLVTSDKDTINLKGVRTEALAQLFCGDRLLGSESGEIQFTEKAISGIPVMNLSHLCRDNKNLNISLDLCPEITENELSEHLADMCRNAPEMQAEIALGGIVNVKLGYVVLNRAKIKKHAILKDLQCNDIRNIISVLKSFRIVINGPKGFDSAQITCGGISTEEIHPENMMSKINDGLFFCGEIIDIHGDCGGYNLHLAWTTGRIAGNSAAEYLKL